LELLERSDRLSLEGRDAEIAFRTGPRAERALLVALSPDLRSWRLARWSGGELHLERYRDRRLVAKRSLEGRDDAGVRVFRSGRRMDFYTGQEHASVSIPEGWRWWAVRRSAREDGPVSWGVRRFRSIRRTDAFERPSFAQGDGWKRVRGPWSIHTHGGGEGKSANAFLLRADAEREPCVASTGWKLCANYRAAISVRPASRSISYGLEVGNPDAGRVTFRWNGQTGRWEVVFRSAEDKKQVLLAHPLTPPEGNWVRLALRLDSPFLLTPMLNGVALGRIELPAPVYGRVHLLAEGGTVRFDDFRMDEGSSEEGEGTPLFVESKSFGSKPIKEKKDEDFVKWAHDTLCYEIVGTKFANHWYPSLRYRVPLYGDFTYRASPTGARRVFVRLDNEKGWERRFNFHWTGDRWATGKMEAQHAVRGAREPHPLKLFYRGGVLYHGAEKAEKLDSFEPHMPMRITLCTPGHKMQPEEHSVFSRTLWNEFFQQAPVGWRWWAGDFGMQYRWACQPYWNFMGGWSRQYAAGFSRAAYEGNQTIEYYISMKDLLKGQQRHRYLRQDLNFSFCTDGKSPSSGYSLLFGGFGTGATYLMKGTEVLASTEEFTLPRFERNHHDVHWRWWHFRIEKRGGRIRVFGDEKLIFDVRDASPISGGHLAFWSVEDGFLLARIRVAAEQRVDRPRRFWCRTSDRNSTWKRLHPAGALLRTEGQWAEVTNRAGGGPMAIRWQGETVDLEEKPVLRLPFQADTGTKVNLHLQISGRSYILPLTGPTEGTRQVLTPRWDEMSDKEFFWRLYTRKQLENWRFLPRAKVEGDLVEINLLQALGQRAGGGALLQSLSVGNTSNKDYLLAGFGGNGPGTSYRVGPPQWHSATVAAQ
jgi:hypothetical protein